MRLVHGVRFAVGTLSVFPVRVERVDRAVAGQAMTLAPAVGLMLALVAALPLALPVPPLLAAALAAGLLAVLTRGLHLDGLADLADGLGSGKPAPAALDIMKKSDIGPFGVVTLVLTLLIQVLALADAGITGLLTACVAGRLALTWACRSGVPAAREEGLGAMVAGTVRPLAAWLVTLAAVLAAAVLGLLSAPGTPFLASGAEPGMTESYDARDAISVACLADSCPAGFETWGGMLSSYPVEPLVEGTGLDLPGVVALPAALLTGLVAALLLLRHARRRLGGITGDVLGALVETATAAALVTAAVLG
ncbi:adenosylcobinamide-GDP ribazoletransferase [Nonomuraea sp. NPDC002799]